MSSTTTTTTTTGSATTDQVHVAPGARRAYAILTGIATLFVFVQFFTSSEFIRAKGPSAELWTSIHGVTAYGLLVPALAAAVIAVVVLRRTAPVITVVSVLLFIASLGQWGTGHLISTMGMDGWTPLLVRRARAGDLGLGPLGDAEAFDRSVGARDLALRSQDARR